MERRDAGGKPADADAAEARLAEHGGEPLRWGEGSYALHQIGVGVPLAGEHGAEGRNNAEGIDVVQPVETGRWVGSEFETEETPPGPQHPPGLGQRAVDAGHVADTEGDGIGVHAARTQRQRLRIAHHPLDGAEMPIVPEAVAPRLDHGRARVADQDSAIAADAFENAARDVAGAAGGVQQGEARTGIEPVHHLALPQAVDAAAHQVVHQIVAMGDATEEIADQVRLLVRGHASITEPSVFGSVLFAVRRTHGADHIPAFWGAPCRLWTRFPYQETVVSRAPGRYSRAMPELPEVETVRRGLAQRLAGRRIVRVIVRRRDLRRPIPRGFEGALEGRRIGAFGRRGKYLLAHLEGARVLIVHLGMSGRLAVVETASGNPHEHVLFCFDDGAVLSFTDHRRFGSMDIADEGTLSGHALFRHMGPEPLSEGFTGVLLAERLRGKKTPVKAALLDQRVVAGLGNIYVCEALYYGGVSPRRSAHTVQGARAARLAVAIREVLDAAIEAGGSSLRDYVQASGELGYFQHRFAVYDRLGRPCPGCDCGGGVRRMVQSGRSTFYCAKRQR